MITPALLVSLIFRTARRVASMTAVRSISMMRAQWPGSSAKRSSPLMPALLNAISKCPKYSTAQSKAEPRSSVFVTSQRRNAALPPFAPAISTVCRPSSSSTSATTTFAPRSASASTAARPIPEAPPLTTATLSSISIGYSFRERFLFWLEMRETLSAVHPAPPANQRDDGGHVAALDMTGHHVVQAAEQRRGQSFGAHPSSSLSGSWSGEEGVVVLIADDQVQVEIGILINCPRDARTAQEGSHDPHILSTGSFEPIDCRSIDLTHHISPSWLRGRLGSSLA